MIRHLLFVFLLMVSSSVCGQEITTTVLSAKKELVGETLDSVDQDINSAIGLALGNALTPGLSREETSNGSGAVLRGLLRINGKTNDFDRGDLKHLAQYAGLPRGSEKPIIQRTVEAFTHWKKLATDLSIPAKLQEHVLRTLRLEI